MLNKKNSYCQENDNVQIIKNLVIKKGLRISQLQNKERVLILLAVIFLLKVNIKYSEQEINKIIDEWCFVISHGFITDRAELRRTLVEANYLERTRDCKFYCLGDINDEDELIRDGLSNYDLLQIVKSTLQEYNHNRLTKKKVFTNNQSS